MKTFKNTFLQYDWDCIKNKIYTATSHQVESVLNKRKRTIEDFMVLLSPAAAPTWRLWLKWHNILLRKDLVRLYRCMHPYI